MIVAVFYQFHDYEPKIHVIDTEKLDKTNKFELDLFDLVNSNREYICIDGKLYNDNWGGCSGNSWDCEVLGKKKIDKAVIFIVDFESF